VGELRMIVAKDRYVPKTRTTRVHPGHRTREDYTLFPPRC
jgi:hypothetical protein